MRKQRIFIVIVVALVTLLFSAGPVLAEKEEFTGFRIRDGAVDPGTKIMAGCNITGSDQTANWDVFTDNTLVSGDWENSDTKTNVLIEQYRVAGVWYDCDPTDPPDPVPSGANIIRKAGIVHGPFTLVPDAYEGCGHWEGVWKVWFLPDSDRIISATAQGVGVLEGLKLKVFNKIPAGEDPTLNGFIVYPPSVVLPPTCP